MVICFGISTIAKLWKWHVNNLNTEPGCEAERLLTGSGKRTERFWPACWKSAAADLLFKKTTCDCVEAMQPKTYCRGKESGLYFETDSTCLA